MSHPVAPVALTEGNTNSLSQGKEKRKSGAQRWQFTWNNYPENWEALLAPVFEGCQWIAGYEVGEQGTPHLQGYVEFPKKTRPIGYKGAPKQIHWGDKDGKCCKAPRADNVKYCLKDGNKAGGTLKVQRPNPEIEIYGWQCEVDEWLATEPDNRSIGWVWSSKGGRGKSSFVRHLVQKRDALVCSGKAADMKYMITKYEEKNGIYPELIVFDVPRSSFKFLSYTGIEEIKNGIFASTKYECSMVQMPYPHVIVLCNFAPDMDDEDMSSDRYKIWNVDPERIPDFMLGIPGCHQE